MNCGQTFRFGEKPGVLTNGIRAGLLALWVLLTGCATRESGPPAPDRAGQQAIPPAWAWIRPSVDAARHVEPAGDSRDEGFVRRVTELHVRRTVAELRERSPVLRALVDSGQVGVVGALYDLESGRVRFFGE